MTTYKIVDEDGNCIQNGLTNMAVAEVQCTDYVAELDILELPLTFTILSTDGETVRTLKYDLEIVTS
jgi:hypothetical protein